MTRLGWGVCVSGKVCVWICAYLVLTGCGVESVRSVGTNGVKDEAKNQPNSNGGNSPGSAAPNGTNSSPGTNTGANNAYTGNNSGTESANSGPQNGNQPELNLNISRVCSSARSTSLRPFFEIVDSNKILSIELIKFDSSAMGSQTIPNIRYTPLPSPSNRIVLASQNLSSVDLDQNGQRQMTVNYNQLTINQLSTEERARSFVLVSVCLDKNQNGLCSDELYQDSLTLRQEPGVLSLDEILSPIELWVYHGRYRSQTSTPNLCEIQGAS